MPLPIQHLPPPNTEPVCPYFNVCGGCDTQDIRYSDQVLAKDAWLKSIFSSESESASWLPFLHSNQAFPIFFRNKIRFSFIQKDGKIWPSRHQKGDDNADIAVDHCFLQSPEANLIIQFVADYAQKNDWTLFDPKTGSGWFKHLLIRHGKQTDQILISLVTTEHQIKNYEDFVFEITKKIPKVISIFQSKTSGRNNQTITDKHLFGSESITEKIGKYIFRISPHAFFQTNSDMVESLYSAISEHVPEYSIVWDLYAGSATIGTFVSSRAEKVVCIESNPQNNSDAEWNIHRNNTKNIMLAHGRVEDVCTSAFIAKEGKPDCIIVDPPRAGLSPVSRDILAGIRPKKLIYISCNPSTCLRDTEELIQRGFTLTALQGIDMFPHSLHCEMIAIFS